MILAGRLAHGCAALFCAIAAPVAALQVELPLGAQLTAERPSTLDSFDLPVGPFDGVIVPVLTIEGAIQRRAWRITSPGLTLLQIVLPIRDQLAAQGYDSVFECVAANCGGFDFRFNIEVLPGPNMYVDIGEYRYLAALRGGREDPQEAVGVLVSVTRGAAYVQIIEARRRPASDTVLPPTAVPPQTQPDPTGQAAGANPIGSALTENGHAVLSELVFATGTTELEPGPIASLAQLAEFMEAKPEFRVLLVGHTDTVGALAGNIALSRARARSVRSRLMSEYGIDAARIDAEGMGYLAPIASNLTEEGRRQNRRVEAVLLPVSQ
ncbi:MAG: OmpA family protein [Roseobacter sp.]|jgi:OOP family OmpA-OmpF porin|nr:OmpA family protein [Roseobacter sp.]